MGNSLVLLSRPIGAIPFQLPSATKSLDPKKEPPSTGMGSCIEIRLGTTAFLQSPSKSSTSCYFLQSYFQAIVFRYVINLSCCCQDLYYVSRTDPEFSRCPIPPGTADQTAASMTPSGLSIDFLHRKKYHIHVQS